jgi:hypothetical protein
MGLLAWWRRRRDEKRHEAESIDQMRRADEPRQPAPSESYLSQTRD